MNLKMRLPYLWESWVGVNMNFYYAKHVPPMLLTNEIRSAIKSNQLSDIKAKIFKGVWEIDDPVDLYSKHTLLHDSVVLDRRETFDFLMQ